jgi:hypothetical protein
VSIESLIPCIFKDKKKGIDVAELETLALKATMQFPSSVLEL